MQCLIAPADVQPAPYESRGYSPHLSAHGQSLVSYGTPAFGLFHGAPQERYVYASTYQRLDQSSYVCNSVTGVLTSGDYQLDFTTPGISPRKAKLRKQIRHMANLRRYPRDLPHTRQRRYRRTANFGVLFDLLIRDFFAILLSFRSSLAPEGHPEEPQQLPTLRIGLRRGDNSD